MPSNCSSTSVTLKASVSDGVNSISTELLSIQPFSFPCAFSASAASLADGLPLGGILGSAVMFSCGRTGFGCTVGCAHAVNNAIV